eukprot:3371792-Pyramimonas_sp.AAC.1
MTELRKVAPPIYRLSIIWAGFTGFYRVLPRFYRETRVLRVKLAHVTLTSSAVNLVVGSTTSSRCIKSFASAEMIRQQGSSKLYFPCQAPRGGRESHLVSRLRRRKEEPEEGEANAARKRNQLDPYVSAVVRVAVTGTGRISKLSGCVYTNLLDPVTHAT